MKVAEELVKEKMTLREERPHGGGQREGRDHVEGSKAVAVPTSDAILSCPACMTTLCLDCQRSLTA